jgi:hypothetical protein
MKQRTIRKASTALTITAVIILIGIYALKTGTPPKPFLETRIQALGVANNLALLVANSYANLEKVAVLAQENDYTQASKLITYEFSQRQEKQNSAVALASQLDQMAKTSSLIDSGRARGYALQAITSGVAMVSRMISYNDSLDQLFQAIDAKINGQDSGPEARAISASLNNDAKTINQLNAEFNAQLRKFDNVYGIK